MRKLALTFFAAFVSLLCASAQEETVEHKLTGLEVSVKRCFKENNKVFVDLVIKNPTSRDCHLTLWNPVAVDDEGVTYRQDNNYWEVEPDNRAINCIVQSGITKRYRMVIQNPDRFATGFQLIDIQCDWDGCGRYMYGMWDITTIRLRNLTFTEVEP